MAWFDGLLFMSVFAVLIGTSCPHSGKDINGSTVLILSLKSAFLGSFE
jgi:hypothetical protein